MNVQIWNDVTLTYTLTYTSDAMKVINTDGYFSLQWAFLGSGSCKIEVLSSNDGVNFIDCNPDITAAGTLYTSTPMAEVIMIACKYCKIKVTPATADLTHFSAWFYGVERVSA